MTKNLKEVERPGAKSPKWCRTGYAGNLLLRPFAPLGSQEIKSSKSWQEQKRGENVTNRERRVTYPGRGPPLSRLKTWCGLRSLRKEVIKSNPWHPPLLTLTNTNKGCTPSGTIVLCKEINNTQNNSGESLSAVLTEHLTLCEILCILRETEREWEHESENI